MTGNQPIHYLQYNRQQWEIVDAQVIQEATVSLTVNGQVWLSFMCTPTQLEALALGFLFNEGIIEDSQQVASVRPCDNGGNVDVWLYQDVEKPAQWRRTTGCTGGVTSEKAQTRVYQFPEETLTLSPEQVIQGMEQLFHAQEIYRQTRGIHCSALSDGSNLRLQAEDIGRHNTLDKLAGLALLDSVDFRPRMVFTTGRISSEMLQKSARLGASVVVSRTAASSMAIELADQYGITLIGYARRTQFNVYTHSERLNTAIVVRDSVEPASGD